MKREFWIGSTGPFLYDDEDSYDDAVPMAAFRGHSINVDNVIVANDPYRVRSQIVSNISNPASELGSISGRNTSGLLIAYQLVSGNYSPTTFYLWTEDAGLTADVPYIVAGSISGCYWVAVAGRYSVQPTTVRP